MIGDRNSQEVKNQDVVVVEPCLVTILVRRVCHYTTAPD